jgi:transcriptional regulator with XRE-family HTH domain
METNGVGITVDCMSGPLRAKRVSANSVDFTLCERAEATLPAARISEQKEMSRPSNLVDAYVGARLRMRRVMLGMSQGRLGELLGVTFQQIQKYEKGANRISASRLKHAAQVLETTIDFFLEGAPVQPSSNSGLAESAMQPFDVAFLSTTEGLQLNRAFLQIRDAKVRRRIVDLVVSLASPENDGGQSVR